MGKRTRGLVMAAATVLVVAIVPGAVPERADAAPAPSPSLDVALPVGAQLPADGTGPRDVALAIRPRTDAADDPAAGHDSGGSPLGLLVTASVCVGVGVLMLATRQPRPIGRRRRRA